MKCEKCQDTGRIQVRMGEANEGGSAFEEGFCDCETGQILACKACRQCPVTQQKDPRRLYINQVGDLATIEINNGYRTYRIRVAAHSEGIEVTNLCDQLQDSQGNKHGSAIYRNKTDRDKMLFSNAEGKCCWQEYETI